MEERVFRSQSVRKAQKVSIGTTALVEGKKIKLARAMPAGFSLFSFICLGHWCRRLWNVVTAKLSCANFNQKSLSRIPLLRCVYLCRCFLWRVRFTLSFGEGFLLSLRYPLPIESSFPFNLGDSEGSEGTKWEFERDDRKTALIRQECEEVRGNFLVVIEKSLERSTCHYKMWSNWFFRLSHLSPFSVLLAKWAYHLHVHLMIGSANLASCIKKIWHNYTWQLCLCLVYVVSNADF